MADHEKDRGMDEMLESLLAGYSSAEPRPGLESRILANLSGAADRETSTGWWSVKWLWAGAAIAAAIIVAAVLIGLRRHVVPPTNTVAHTRQPAPWQPEVQPSLPVTVPTIVPRNRKASLPVRPQNATLALSQRPPVFPTPTPLSEQEHLLLRYFTGTPREEVVAQSHPDEPVVSGQDQTEAIPDLSHIPQRPSNTR